LTGGERGLVKGLNLRGEKKREKKSEKINETFEHFEKIPLKFFVIRSERNRHLKS
jgi:hypothetical protein